MSPHTTMVCPHNALTRVSRSVLQDLTHMTYLVCASASQARMAGEVELKRYEAELAACKVSAHTMGGLQLDKLPGPEALEERGKTDGQTRVVRQVRERERHGDR